MSVDKVSVDKVSVDKVSVDKLSVDRVSVDKVSEDEITLDEMSWCKFSAFPSFKTDSLAGEICWCHVVSSICLYVNRQ